MQIPISSIKIPERVRKDLGDLEPLMASLRQIGQLNPITITPKYELIAGHRRLTAATKLGWRTIDVVILSGIDEIRALEMELAENLYRKDFTPDEVLEGWKKLDKLRHPTFARRLGTSIKNVFSKLCFWRKKKNPAVAVEVPEAPVVEILPPEK